MQQSYIEESNDKLIATSPDRNIRGEIIQSQDNDLHLSELEPEVDIDSALINADIVNSHSQYQHYTQERTLSSQLREEIHDEKYIPQPTASKEKAGKIEDNDSFEFHNHAIDFS